MNYDIIFADLDGTLLDDNKMIPDNNINALKTIVENNIDIVICSGRSHMSLKNIDFNLGINNINGYGIGFNGGSIFKRCSYEVIAEHKLNADISKKIIEFCKEYNTDVMFYAENMLWVESINERTISYSRHSILAPRKAKKFVESCIYDTNKVIAFGENNVLNKIQSEFLKLDISENIECCFSSKNLLEFNLVNVNKGSGVEYIMSLPEFKGKKSLAVGDSYNDITMFDVCDFSVAVKNSEKEIINRTNAVTECTNNQGILSEILEKYIL